MFAARDATQENIHISSLPPSAPTFDQATVPGEDGCPNDLSLALNVDF